MQGFGQLNIRAYVPQHVEGVYRTHLFNHEEMRADLVVLAPGAQVPVHSHENAHELFDVIEGRGLLSVDGLDVPGGPGKCIFVPAGVPHAMHNTGDSDWLVRITYQDRVYPRHIGKLLGRALRKRLSLPLT